MLKRLRQLKNAWRLFFLGAALFPFLFRHLLVLTLPPLKPFSRMADYNGGREKPLTKTLIHQLGSQAQESDSRANDYFPMGSGLPGAERVAGLFCGFPPVFSTPFFPPPTPQGFSVPLRI